ncbi:MAG TPA: HEAT repeat domain-containing protein, partial [Planctomycetaceae bacterium]|nr:HEAT repeat domain-containing protein [Planctomycetaceae bacterium]
PPSIWKLTDTNGDGVADERREWFQGKTLTGCANDLHGPYLGPDGWIYWAKGAVAEQTYERPGRDPFVTRASHLFRSRPDGTGIEPVMTGGMDNPVDVVFTPGGERIFTTTFLVHPGGGERDGLLHAVYGGVHGKVHAVLDGHIRTSPDVLPVLCHLGPAAPCGLARYESGVFGDEYRDNLFAALFNLQKITRHVLKPQGGTFACETHDFLVCDSKDFHPTDVQMDADGSLIVVDTGGWYKLCCPTSQLHKPDVLGAVYRIRKKDAPRVNDPRGNKLDWAKLEPAHLAELLGDSRVAVRQRAIETLAKRGESAIATVRAQDANLNTPAYHLSAVSTATRVDHPAARAYIRERLTESVPDVQLLAIHAVSLWRDRDAVPELIAIVSNADSATGLQRRAAAEALGRIGAKSAVPALLKALSPPVDPILTHSLIYALIELEDPAATAQGLKSSAPDVRAGAMIALDQMRGGKLNVEQVAGELSSAQPRLRETAAWIATRHPEWGDALAGLLRQRFERRDLSATERSDLEHQFARFARSGAIQELLGKRLVESPHVDDRLLVLRAMSQSGLRSIPPSWLAGWKALLEGNDDALISGTCGCIRALALGKEQAPQLADLVPSLRAVGERVERGAATRLDALSLLPPGTLTPDATLFKWLQAQLDPNLPVSQRMTAADVLARTKL